MPQMGRKKTTKWLGLGFLLVVGLVAVQMLPDLINNAGTFALTNKHQHQRRLQVETEKPFDHTAGAYHHDDLPYVSILRERRLLPATTPNTTVMLRNHTNFNPHTAPSTTSSRFDALLQMDCLPSADCVTCLRVKNPGSCETCPECGCYCKSLCNVFVAPPPVGKEIVVRPPKSKRDPHRIIPRIIHQTWFEDIDVNKYPNTGRLVESFRQSGWEYRFYTDDMAAAFLSTHFPPEVRQAYDDLLPGAFKADLFRYCVLLIHGGLYADVDILLESNLDAVIGPDVGFIVPYDSMVRTFFSFLFTYKRSSPR